MIRGLRTTGLFEAGNWCSGGGHSHKAVNFSGRGCINEFVTVLIP